MSLNYQHSEVMGILKKTDEKIKTNYSSSQYIEVLDKLLLNTITPILQSTNFADFYVSGIVHSYMENGRRKISNTGKFQFLSRAALFLSVDNSEKPKIYKSLRLERNLTSIVVRDFLEATKDYKSLKMSLLKDPSPETVYKIKGIEKRIGHNNRIDLGAVITSVNFWHNKYYAFKNKVLEKYMRMITTQAQNYYKHNNSSIELDDLIQNYVMYASKAIDKFDHRQGTLTSYILNWISHARNVTASNENGTAFTLPPNKRRNGGINNISVPMEAEEVQNIEVHHFDDLERDMENERVRRIARIADPLGYARLALGIVEKLSEKEIQAMKRYTVA